MTRFLPRPDVTACLVLMSIAIVGVPHLDAQKPRILWIDALCGDDPVSGYLHQRLNDLARARQWESGAARRGCQWIDAASSAPGREAGLDRDAEAITAAMSSAPADTTFLVLTNSMVAARLNALSKRPVVLNPKLVARDVYLFAADPNILCDRSITPLRVGYLRRSARRAEIVGVIAAEGGRLPSQIDAREVDGIVDLRALLGQQGPKGLQIAAIVADDAGALYDQFIQQIIARAGGVRVAPVTMCTAQGNPPAAVLERRLDGSVSYLRLAASPQPPDTSSVPMALLRPGQEPVVTSPKGLLARLSDAVFSTVTAEEVRAVDFQDYPVLLAQGPQEGSLASDAALRQTLSTCYFEGMYDSLVRGLNPCREQADILFGAYLLGSYLDDPGSAYKGCALQAYYQLMSTVPGRPGTDQQNVDLLKLKPALSMCLSHTATPITFPPSEISDRPLISCEPSKKELLEAKTYGTHYAYYREGLRAIDAGMSGSGPVREESLRLAENCLVQALKRSRLQDRSCGKFSQGLFVVPFEPSLPLGIIKLKSGR